MRGPAFGDSTLAPGGVPARRTPAESFDRVALRTMAAVVEQWTSELGDVELAVEEVPMLPQQWVNSTVPLASYVEASGGGRPRRPRDATTRSRAAI